LGPAHVRCPGHAAQKDASVIEGNQDKRVNNSYAIKVWTVVSITLMCKHESKEKNKPWALTFSAFTKPLWLFFLTPGFQILLPHFVPNKS
jgi:hypothetical protein